MTSFATEHSAEIAGQPGDGVGVPPGEHYMDPEAAVDEALRATHDAEFAPVEPPQGHEGIRTLGRHMLGLLEQEEATEHQRLGARLILMNGTSTERKLLFLYDTAEVLQRLNTGDVSLSELLNTWDMPRSLVELGDAPPAVRQLMRKAQRGDVVSREALEVAAESTFEEIAPHIPAHECVGFLRAARSAQGEPPFRHLQNTKLLRELEAKLPETNGLIDQAVLTEAILHGAHAVRANVRYRYDASRPQDQTARDEVIREADAISGKALAAVDPTILAVSKKHDGSLSAANLSDAINATEKGLGLEAYSTLNSLSPNFTYDFKANRDSLPDVDTLNRMADTAGLPGSDRYQQAEEILFKDVYSIQKLPLLATVAELQRDPRLAMGADGFEQLRTMAAVIKGAEPETQAQIKDELAALAEEIDLGSALQVYNSREDAEALLDVARRGDKAALADLKALLASPSIADMLKRGELTFYAGADQDAKTMFTEEIYSQQEWLSRKRQFLAEVAQNPRVIALCEEPATRRAFSGWVNSALNANNHSTFDEKHALLDQIMTVTELDGAKDALAAIIANNPDIVERISMTSIVGTGSPESVLEKLQLIAQLPPGSVDLRLIAGMGYHAQAFDQIAKLQSFGAMEYLGDGSIFRDHPVAYAEWFLNEETGSLREKALILNDPAVRQDIADLQDTFVAQLSPGLLTSAGVGEWHTLTRGLKRISQDEDLGTLYDDNIIDTNNRALLARTLANHEDIDGAIASVGQLYHTQKPLLDDIAAIDRALSSGVIVHWAKGGDQEYLESWRQALDDNPVFWKFISAQGAGYNLRGQIINGLTETDNPHEMAASLTSMFTKQQPLWLLNMEIAKWAIKEEAYHDGMMVSELPTSLPITKALQGEALDQMLASGVLLKPIKDMTVDEKRLWLDVTGLDDEAISNIHTVAFNKLQKDTQQTALAYRLFETIEISRSEHMRQQANNRNAAFALSGANVWHEGMLTHFTRHPGARASLINGNLAGEMIGLNSEADNYPYNVDFVAADSEVLLRQTHAERLSALASNGFGPIAMHYRREPGAFRYGEEFAVPNRYNGQHRLLFGGIPATEISAMSVRQTDLIAPLKRDLVRAGIYIPLLDNNGTLVFGPAEYQTMREDGNYDRVRPEVVDGAFMRENSQGGSNEGAEMFIPAANGEPESWYVKFAQDDDDHLWTELLTDQLYAGVDPTLVAETKAIIIDGRFARASKMVKPNGSVTNAGRNRGFILDAWVGGWDAVYNADNLIPQGPDAALRIDNGNALDYRARGLKKGTDDTEPFGSVVSELEFGGNNKDLGRGMRQKYPDLTDENIRGQLARFRERATDQLINTKVDGVRRSKADRAYLKGVLKARRDYILTYFSELSSQ
jgi:hypothetical protein